MRKIPSRKECLILLDSYKLPTHIIRHSFVVNEVAKFLAGRLGEKGVKVDKELIDRATILHDLLRIVDIKDVNGVLMDSPMKEEGKKFWIGMQEKYPGVHHANVAYEELKDKWYKE